MGEKNFACDESTILELEKGLLQGYLLDGTYIFKGIPYAKAERFQMPRGVESWQGVLDATTFGYVCPLLKQEVPSGELIVPHRYWLYGEECQNLNIWTQSIDSKAKKPVIVWFHGGGFFAGSAIEHICYEGENMSKFGDVVVVSVNHRLNVLGYLDLAPFSEKYKNSGNVGNADLEESLRWIQKNISVFGGDPDNVTIFGQSGGGMKVSSLMQTPSANGLFHKGVIMSGVADQSIFGAQGDGTQIVKAILLELGIDETEIEKLESVPYEVLAAAYNKVSPGIKEQGYYVGGYPQINDYYLGEIPFVPINENAKSIPLMVGTVFGEFAFGSRDKYKDGLSQSEKEKLVAEHFGGELAKKLISEFKKAYPDKCITDLTSLDVMFRKPSRNFVLAKSSYTQSDVYEYMFTMNFPYLNKKPAWHCADIPFFFHNTQYSPVCHTDKAKELEEKMFNALMNFARTGDPNNELLPDWPKCTPDDEAVMIFDSQCDVRHNFDSILIENIALDISKVMGNVEKDVKH